MSVWLQCVAEIPNSVYTENESRIRRFDEYYEGVVTTVTTGNHIGVKVKL